MQRRLGNLVVEVPLLRCNKSADSMLKIYDKLHNEPAEGMIYNKNRFGRDTFMKLLRVVTTPVKEESCLSYFYTDGVVHTFPFLRNLQNRLSKIAEFANPAEQQGVGELKNMIL